MDPYIEACGWWEGFHGHLIEAIFRAVAKTLPRRYTVITGTRSYVVLMGADGKEAHVTVPDVTITEPAEKARPRKRQGGAAVASPPQGGKGMTMRAFFGERVKERFVEIYAQREERFLVTCIEVLSPSNKRPGSEGWKEYELKRQAMLMGQANFLEIDLIRSGKKMPMLDPWPDSPYSLLVCRASDAPYCRVWPGHFAEPLPAVPLPLLDPDPDLTLDLQPLIDEIYAIGRFDDLINYDQKLTPALPKEDAAKLRALLKARR
jgi:hypothetical protein